MSEEKYIAPDPIKKQLSKPEDFTPPEVLFQQLIDTIRKYHPSSDISQIVKAYRIADDAHKDQKRKSGEPYIIHPLCVAIILAELELDKETIIAGILHDVVEDTVMTKDEIAKEFITSRQKGQLRHLQAFKFTRHSRYNLPAARLKALEQFIQKRAGQLLEL